MRMIWQAIRAVTVEVMGVGAVIFMLFSAAGWTVESAGVQTEQEVERAWNWLQETSDRVATSVQPNLTADQRERFAAERLGFYGRVYGEAAGSFAARAARQLDLPVAPADSSLMVTPNQLLGTL